MADHVYAQQTVPAVILPNVFHAMESTYYQHQN